MELKIRCYEPHQGNANEIRKAIAKYVDNICLPDKYKKEILSTEFIRGNPAYYFNYPYLFMKFPIEEENIINLCIAGALYYQSIMYLDRVLDEDTSLSDVFPLIIACTEETIKILSSFIPLESDFWNIWNKRKIEYLQAYKDDKKGEIITYDDFLTHADRKTAFGKLAIDALYDMHYITKGEYDIYLQIHKYFYGASQIIDDISDIREDFDKKQFNIAISEIKRVYGDKAILNTGEAISKTFFTSNLSEKLFALAADYVNKAYQLALQYNLNYMTEECCRLWNSIVIQQRNVDAYLYQLDIIPKLSKTKKGSNSLEDARHNALEYLQKHQEPDGCWIDFCNNAGTSDSWSTAFVTFMLEKCEMAPETVEKSKEYLKKHLQNDLWGYSHIWISDNDSSIIAILATEDYHQNIEKLTKRFNTDGGVPTYYADNQLLCSLSYVHQWEAGIEGWRQSHPDVSAAALYLLSKVSSFESEKEKLLSYFRNRIHEKLPMVYWWIDDIYTLFFLSLANSVLSEQELNAYIQLKTEEKWQKFRETNDKGDLTVFYLAMLLHLLLYCGRKMEADQVVEHLIELQYTDGSWPESNFMCIPSADSVNPTNTWSWFVGDHGINVRAHEFHRLYTTSLSLMALSEYSSYGD